jgi:hypothetical protein
MPSLLEKLSYFDLETGGTFVIAGDSFLWKEGKKVPEDSKATKLVQRYGWTLKSGDDLWLVFRQKGNRGELTVIRGSRGWIYSLPGRDIAMKGEGLDSLYDALEKGMLTEAFAKAACIKAEFCPQCGWDAERCRCPNKADLLDGKTRADHLASKLFQAREAMHDDSGALTGLRRRPDYGESDSYSVEMNEANSKGACLILDGGVKTASGAKKAELYVTSVEYERGCALKLASFRYSPNPVQAKVFGRRIAENLARQVRGLCGAVAHVIEASDIVFRAAQVRPTSYQSRRQVTPPALDCIPSK